MHCPLKTSKFINPKDEECRLDCAWLVGDNASNVACAIPALVEFQSGGLLTCQNYYELTDAKEDEDGIRE